MILPTQWTQLLLVTLKDYEQTHKWKSQQREYYDLKLLCFSMKTTTCFWNLSVEFCWLRAVWKNLKTGAFKLLKNLQRNKFFSTASSKPFWIWQKTPSLIKLISNMWNTRHLVLFLTSVLRKQFYWFCCLHIHSYLLKWPERMIRSRISSSFIQFCFF